MDILNYFAPPKKTTELATYYESDLLHVRYRPKTFGEFMGNYKQINEIRQWFENKNGAFDNQGLLIVGPTGCGKSDIVRVACDTYGLNVFVRNASHKRTRKELYTYYESVKHFTHNGIFVLDDIETLLNKSDNVSMAEIAKWSGNGNEQQQTLRRTVRVVYMCNSVYDNKITAISLVCKVIRLDYPPTRAMFARCLQIADSEKLVLSDSDMKHLKELIESQRDPRMILNSLHMIGVVHGVQKDVHMDIYDTYRLMLDNNAPFDHKLRHFATDAGTIPIIFQENYIDYAPFLDKDILKRVSDSMSLADVYHKQTFPCTDLSTDTYCVLSTLFPEYYQDAGIKDSKVYKFPQFGLIWTKQSAMYQKRKYWNRIDEHMCDPMILTENFRGAMNDQFKQLLKGYREQQGTENLNKECLMEFLDFYGLTTNAELAYDLYISYNVNTTEKQMTKKAFVTMFKNLVK
jgi:hypothetical protein